MKLLYQIISFLWILGNGLPLVGQSSMDSLFSQQQTELEQLYDLENEDMARLLNGRHHHSYYPTTVGHPFLYEEWTLGSVKTSLYSYHSLSLRYDIFQDALVFAANLAFQKIIWINPDQVLSFSLNGRTFVFLGRGEEIEAMEAVRLSPGYFELLYEGKTQLIAKRLKSISSVQNDIHNDGKFYEKSLRYMISNHQFFPVKKNKDLFRFIDHHQEEITRYLKDKKIRVGKIPDAQFVDLISYYDSL